MVRLSLSAALLSATLSLSALPFAAQSAAAQTTPMSDAERAAFRAEVRAYLMENPEVIFEAVAEFERRNQASQADMDATLVELNAEEIYRDGFSWVTGNPDGDLTLVEFMDYRCGYCRRAQEHVMSLIESDGNIRLVIKEFPILGPQSELMSRLAVAVHQLGGDSAYEVVHDRLMTWQGDFLEADARTLADEVALDGAAVLAHMNSDQVDAVLRANSELARRLQISGTPTFVMGADEAGQLLRGFMPADQMAAAAARLRG